VVGRIEAGPAIDQGADEVVGDAVNVQRQIVIAAAAQNLGIDRAHAASSNHRLARIVSLPARPSSSAVTDPLGVKLGLMPHHCRPSRCSAP